MNSRRDPQPRHVRYNVRHQARLDEETSAKLEELAATLHKSRSAVLRYVLGWGLAHTKGWMVDRSIPARVRTVAMLVTPEQLAQVQEAATFHVASVAAWVRHAMRQVTINDFPESWRAGKTVPRSHDSHYYGTRFMLRLDETTAKTLQHLVQRFAKPRAEIIRQLVAQAKPEDFPKSWQLEAEESRVRRPPPRNSQRSTPTGPLRQQLWRNRDA